MIPRRRLNSQEYEYARNICQARDGNDCTLCTKSLAECDNASTIHHVDGNSYNNPKDGSNWQLTHHSCNVVEYYARKRFEAIDGIETPHIQYQIGTRMELSWMRWMVDQITQNGKVMWDEAKFTGALEADCSPETTKRYLQKHIVNSEHPKALFKVNMDAQYKNQIIFTDHTTEFINRYKDLE